MYGYEVIRELEKRFSGYWRPKTGTIYPALERLEKNRLVTSRIEFREDVPDRKHYALTEKGQAELASTMAYWTKMTEVLENYRESHQAIFRHRAEYRREDVGRLFSKLGEALQSRDQIEAKTLFPSETIGKAVKISPTEPISLKFLYGKEDQRLEIHMEIEWVPSQKHLPANISSASS